MPSSAPIRQKDAPMTLLSTLSTAPPAPTTAPNDSPPERPTVAADRRRSWWPRWATRAISPVAAIVLWQVLSSTGVLPEHLLSGPVQIAKAGWTITANGELPQALLVSLRRVVIGAVLGCVAGVGLGLISGLKRWGENLLDPLVQMLRTLPHLALLPLFILWFGIGELPKVLLVALGVALPLYLNTFAGIRGTDPRLLEVADIVGLSGRDRVRHVVLPSALPNVLVGLRQSLGIAWLSLIVGEQVNASSGLGKIINDAREFLQTDVVVVGLVVYAVLGLLTDAAVRLLERRALAWRQSFRPV
jgi:sulfonate transport system permease protein